MFTTSRRFTFSATSGDAAKTKTQVFHCSRFPKLPQKGLLKLLMASTAMMSALGSLGGNTAFMNLMPFISSALVKSSFSFSSVHPFNKVFYFFVLFF